MPSPALRRPTTNRGLGAGGSAAADGTRLPCPRPPLGSWGQAVGDAGALGYACDAVGIAHLPCRGRPPNSVGGAPPRHRREARRNGPPRTSPRAAPGRHSRADPADGRGARGRTSRGFHAGGSRCVSCRNVNASDVHGIHRENIRPPMGRAARTRPSQGPVHARYVLPATLSSRNTVSITVTH